MKDKSTGSFLIAVFGSRTSKLSEETNEFLLMDVRAREKFVSLTGKFSFLFETTGWTKINDDRIDRCVSQQTCVVLGIAILTPKGKHHVRLNVTRLFSLYQAFVFEHPKMFRRCWAFATNASISSEVGWKTRFVRLETCRGPKPNRPAL